MPLPLLPPSPDGVVGGSKDKDSVAGWSRDSLSAATLVEAEPRPGRILRLQNTRIGSKSLGPSGTAHPPLRRFQFRSGGAHSPACLTAAT